MHLTLPGAGSGSWTWQNTSTVEKEGPYSDSAHCGVRQALALA